MREGLLDFTNSSGDQGKRSKMFSTTVFLPLAVLGVASMLFLGFINKSR
ncbi:MAG UNVERIFIED_CONTAM: hypothetical protein LVR29_20390 [Microcystis novacekii LVE1205-3]|jgi:hypothetical protein